MIRRKLRPVRFATLVSAGDYQGLQNAIEFNTCMWGGMFNCIVPVYKVRPREYSNDVFEKPSTHEILLGYLDTFEPDFVIAPNQTLAALCPYPYSKRVLTRNSTLGVMPGEWHGLCIASLLSDIYEKDFRFAPKSREIDRVLMASRTKSSTGILTAALLGRFPKQRWSKARQDLFDLFNAEELDFDRQDVATRQFDHSISLLNLGSWGLNFVQRPLLDEPTVFYMDATSFTDVIDFWNLRALGWRIKPLAKQWEEVGVANCSKLITRSKSERIQVMRGRSVSKQEFDSFCNSIRSGDKLYTRRDWHPRIWKKHYRFTDNARRRDVQSATDSISLNDDSGVVSASSLYPNWIRKNDEFGFHYTHWVNVLSTRLNRDEFEFALVLPSYSSAFPAFIDFERATCWNNSEGFIVSCSNSDSPLTFELPTHWKVFESWFRDQGIEVVKSQAGKNVLELARACRGLSNAYYLASIDMLNLYNGLSRGVSITYKSLVDSVKRARSIGGEKHFRKILSFMNESRSIRVGLDVKCLACDRSNWYPLSELAENLSCNLCLRTYPFPIGQPTLAQWSYRAIGPFSLPDFAGGAYSVLLTARFLGWLLNEQIAWYPGIELDIQKNRKLEIDLAVWWSSSEIRHEHEHTLVFAECKTFDEFKDKDFKRAKELLGLFPDCTIVFATLRNTLTVNEQRKLRAIALAELRRWRKTDRALRLMVLTGHELLQNLHAPDCWKVIAGNKYSLVDARYQFKMGHDKLQRVCSITQVLHLGMQDYDEYIDADCKKLVERRKKRKEA